MDRDEDIDDGVVAALRSSYGRQAWWIVRLNRVLEPSRAAEPTRPDVPPRRAVLPRQPTPPRPN
ncbi:MULTISPECIES: hypothetical protein [unclassified Bradyrhizobium]|uniref:hypothetical protein n=1 Tax=unclassified Bradyrhizobium TaxID=2631580 RepID=UPI0024787BDC|nr:MULTISPECIES: hypothetical protein [unclassified Bradyrhizobium]WGS17258.1 hypothetical protein MTX22_21510 [Bradyrhizobium sp. ISRA463]WGS30994.1 hypothetical protein MTX19_19195 [Bradyrhizobium sp. ISRA464]